MVEILGQVVGPGGLLGQEGVEVGGQLVLGHHHLLAHCLQLILTVIHTYILCYTQRLVASLSQTPCSLSPAHPSPYMETRTTLKICSLAIYSVNKYTRTSFQRNLIGSITDFLHDLLNKIPTSLSRTVNTYTFIIL
jgi:hypothetical protein